MAFSISIFSTSISVMVPTPVTLTSVMLAKPMVADPIPAIPMVAIPTSAVSSSSEPPVPVLNPTCPSVVIPEISNPVNTPTLPSTTFNVAIPVTIICSALICLMNCSPPTYRLFSTYKSFLKVPIPPSTSKLLLTTV